MANELQTKLDTILEDKNTNLLPENLKAGVTCLGIEGTMEAGVDTSDATATAEDLAEGKTAYINNEKIEGTVPVLAGWGNEKVLACDRDSVYFVPDDDNSSITVYTSDTGNACFTVYGTYKKAGIIESEEYNTRVMLDNISDTTPPQLVVCMSQKKAAESIGLTSDKLVSGNTILGVEGTVETGGTIDVPEFTPDTDDVQGEYIEDCNISYVNDDTQLMDIKITTAKDFLIREGSFIRGEIPYEEVNLHLGITPEVLTKGTTILGVEGTAEVGSSTSETPRADYIIKGQVVNGVTGTNYGFNPPECSSTLTVFGTSSDVADSSLYPETISLTDTTPIEVSTNSGTTTKSLYEMWQECRYCHAAIGNYSAGSDEMYYVGLNITMSALPFNQMSFENNYSMLEGNTISPCPAYQISYSKEVYTSEYENPEDVIATLWDEFISHTGSGMLYTFYDPENTFTSGSGVEHTVIYSNYKTEDTYFS